VHDPTKPARLDKETTDDFAQLGVIIEAGVNETGDDDVFYVWQPNWPSVEAFLACETQWHYVSGLSVMMRTGINYAALDVVLRRKKSKPHVFDDVRIIERAALTMLDEGRNNG
jgi:hypothetical protein